MTRKHLVFAALCMPLSGGCANAEDWPSAGQARTDARGIVQQYVPEGCFQMGTTEADSLIAMALPDRPSWTDGTLASEQPAHEVCLTRGYWIDRTEVTNAAFSDFVTDGGYERPEFWSTEGLSWLESQYVPVLPYPCGGNDAPDQPRMCVTFYEAEAYARWRGGALPTEAQWEYAARGPESLTYPWGNEWDASRAHVLFATQSSPVGGYPQGVSWIGAMDMAGNAMEWVADWLDADYYAASPAADPQGPEKGTIKVEKGGWWGSNPYVARSAYRHFEDTPRYNDNHIGFRVVSPR